MRRHHTTQRTQPCRHPARVTGVHGKNAARTPRHGGSYARRMTPERRSRTASLEERLAAMRVRSEKLPGGPLIRQVLENERELGGGLIAGGVAFRIFLWLLRRSGSSQPQFSPSGASRIPMASNRPPAVSASAQQPLTPPPKRSSTASEARCSFCSSGSSSLRGSRSVPSGRCSWPTHSRGICRRRGSAARSTSSRSSTRSISWRSSLRPAKPGSRPRSAAPRCSESRSRSHSRLRSRSLRCGCSPTAQRT